MSGFLPVAFGGALGACGRYAVSLLPWTDRFPLATLLTNLLGALLIGLVAGLSGGGRLTKQWTLFWKTGVCGGFTTFSTFSLESMNLLREGRWLAGGVYIVLSVGFCLIGVAVGQRISQAILRP